MIVKEVHITKFRAFNDVSFKLGKLVTAIAGRNATQKTTLLGMIGQPFSITQEKNPMFGCKTIDGYDFKSQFGEKFKFSSTEKAGDHLWLLDLYGGIHNYKEEPKSHFIAESIFRDKKKGTLRIWNAEDRSRKAGSGFVQIPVYYLSLSRLYPIGEVSNTKPLDIDLTDVEKKYCLQHYKEILHIMDIEGVASIGVEVKSPKQKFAGITDGKHDIFTNSAGEGNIFRILLAICSFKRLKERYGDDYKGGILLIDELDAAVYPYSQEKLVKYLFNAAHDAGVQVVFTTHSPTVLETVIACRYERQKKSKPENGHGSVVYLEPRDGQIKALNIGSMGALKRCINDMNLIPPVFDVQIYTEDEVAASFVKCLLKQYGINDNNYFEFKELSLGWAQYVMLLEKKAFGLCDSLILFDADVPHANDYRHHEDFLKSCENVVFLPVLVERDLFELLRDRDNYKIFYEHVLKRNGFTHDICFRDYPLDFEDYKKGGSTNVFKVWFKYVEETVDRKTLFNFWYYRNKCSASKFIENLCTAHNKLADRLKLDPLSPMISDEGGAYDDESLSHIRP